MAPKTGTPKAGLEHLIETTQEMLDTQTAEMAKEFADVKTILATLLVRLEILEVAGGAAKRPPRTTRKIGAAGAGAEGAGPGAGAGGDPDAPDADRVVNSRLYARYAYATNAEFRGARADEAFLEACEQDPACKKCEAGSTKRLMAEGLLFWMSGSAEQKQAITAEFKVWKSDRERGGLPEAMPADE